MPAVEGSKASPLHNTLTALVFVHLRAAAMMCELNICPVKGNVSATTKRPTS